MTVGAVTPSPRQVSYREYGLEFPAEVESVYVVRAMIRVMCSTWRVPQDAADTAELLGSEVATNAVSVSGGEVLRCTLRKVLGYLYFDCSDYDPAIPVTPSMPGGEELSGRGLALVKELASSYGWERLSGRQGKICWFTLATG